MKRSAGAVGGVGGELKKRKVIKKLSTETPDDELGEMENKSADKSSKRNRIRYYQKFKLERAMRKQARREKRKKERVELGEAAAPKLVPKTIDNMREGDDTFVQSSDEEVAADEADDEYYEYYNADVEPLILITTGTSPCPRTRSFIPDLLSLFPNSQYFPRQAYTVKQITQYAVNRGFTDVMIVGDSGGGQKQRPYSLIVTHLPQGPSHWYRISSVVLHDEIKGAAERSEHYPQLILKGFGTRLGKRIRRQLDSMFPQVKDDK
eukprot:gene10395-16011_t